MTLMAMASTSLYAAPSAFEAKDCGPLNLENHTTSTVVRDHKDCSKVWVLPPTMGEVKTGHFKKGANLGFCSEMKSLQGITRRISQRIERITYDIDAQTPELKNAEKKVLKAKEYLAKAKADPGLVDYNNVNARLAEVEDRIVDLHEKINSCTQHCNVLVNDFNTLTKEKRDLNRELSQLRRSNRIAVRSMTKAQAQVTAAEDYYNLVNDRMLNELSKQSRLKNELFNLYKNYAKLEGGFVGINYDLKWDENVTELEVKYPYINFSKVATKDTRIHANFIGSTDQASYLESLPMILDYSIGGMEYQPYGQERESELSGVPSEIQGDLRLSVIGACPYYYSNFLTDTSGELQERTDLNNTEFGFGMSMTYKYPAVFKFQMKARYNLYKFYKKVVKSGSSGGFFSKKSWKKVSETKIDKDTFEIEWLDEAQMYTQEEKNTIRQTVKEELIARALQNMAEPAGARPTNVSAINVFNPQPGALVVARGLEKTCGWYSYKCQAASWVLKGLTSIFGSAKAEAEFQSTHDSTSEEIWNEENVLWRPAASSFVEK